MCNNHYSDTTVTVIKNLMDALIDISVIADRVHKHAATETEYTGALVLIHWLSCKLAPTRRWKQPAKCSWLMCRRYVHDSPHR